MNYAKLRGVIREVYGTQEDFARAMSMHPSSLSFKLTNRRDWTGAEIEKACILLGIPLQDVHIYFFSSVC